MKTLRHETHFGACILIAVPLFVVCLFRHVCIEGHMRHPPYPWWEIALDAVWVLCFVAASLRALRSHLRGRVFLAALPIALIVSRLAVANGARMLYGPVICVFEIPAVLYLTARAILTLSGFPGRQGTAQV